MKNNFLKTIAYFLVILVFLEVFFRIAGVLKTDGEKMGYGYNSLYRYQYDTWFHTWEPNSIGEYNTSEFQYTNTYNEWGHREKSIHPFIENDSSILILCLGDSFTEGDGAPYDSTWVRRLDYHLNENYEEHFILYNAGVCGSDVVFNYKILEQKLKDLKPKMIIELINTSDILDLMYLGGDERFNDDGSSSGKVGPKWEKIYKHIHLFRLWVHTFGGYNYNLIKNKDEQVLIKNSIAKIKHQAITTFKWCEKNNIPYLLFLQPTPTDVFYYNSFKELSVLEEFAFVVNLSPNMTRYLKSNNREEYAWLENGHFNGKGYFILGDFIYHSLQTNQAFQDLILEKTIE